jgi:hypothetical protein
MSDQPDQQDTHARGADDDAHPGDAHPGEECPAGRDGLLCITCALRGVPPPLLYRQRPLLART